MGIYIHRLSKNHEHCSQWRGNRKWTLAAWNLSDFHWEVDGIIPLIAEQHHSMHYQGMQSYNMSREGEPKIVVNKPNDHKSLFNSCLHYNQIFFSKIYILYVTWTTLSPICKDVANTDLCTVSSLNSFKVVNTACQKFYLFFFSEYPNGPSSRPNVAIHVSI